MQKKTGRGVRSGDSRRRLIKAAVESIVEVGYARTSVGEVVKRARMTKGAHVYHFKSKLDLMRETVSDLFEQVHARLHGIDLRRANTVRDIENVLQAIADVTLDTEGTALLEVWMASRTDPGLRRIFAKLEADNERRRERDLAQLFGKDVVRRTNLAALFDGLVMLVRGLALQHILEPGAMRNPAWRLWRRKVAAEIHPLLKRQEGRR